MMNLNLDALEATARAATPGPWVLDNSGWSKPYDIPDRIAGGVTDDDWTNVIMPQDEQGGGSWSRDEDAKYIAALDPTTTLALIARIREAEEAADEEAAAHNDTISAWREAVDKLRDAEATIDAVRAHARKAVISEDPGEYDGFDEGLDHGASIHAETTLRILTTDTTTEED